MTTTTAPKSTTARKPATRKSAGTGCKPAAGKSAGTAAPKPAAAGKPEPKLTVTECERCGFKFPKPQTRTTCRVEAACEKRQAKRARAAAA